MSRPRFGIWLIGARGGVATTSIVGLAALKQKLVEPTGLVSGLPELAALEPAGWDDFLVGGHEIRDVRLADEALRLATSYRIIDQDLVAKVQEELERIDRRIRPGTICNVGTTIEQMAGPDVPRGESPREAIGRIGDDLNQFAEENGLEHVIVVNVASTEPSVDAASLPASWNEWEPLLESAETCPVPASTLYAIAALTSGCSYINFTPSLGSAPEAIDELARRHETRHMGCDGKTGETLMKSVLAPMFAARHLKVMSWVGHNIFGNLDGKVLDDPVNKRAKVASKDHLIGDILGYRPQTHVSIEYIESLGDWKTAWDHIHFQGFLGTPMTLQFTWQGSDSILAAPLVLDLVRFTELARRRGQTGRLTFLASFFKSPYGVDRQDFAGQFRLLTQWAGLED
ncbi:MAG: inositol-3-phosphate synthase [Pirellulales bacterium]|nr:inositol-3-phosphate synthase [Pirellulales bacterium]